MPTIQGLTSPGLLMHVNFYSWGIHLGVIGAQPCADYFDDSKFL